MIAMMQGGMSVAELAGAMVAFGHIALIVLASATWGIAKSTETQGSNTSTAVDNLPAMPTW